MYIYTYIYIHTYIYTHTLQPHYNTVQHTTLTGLQHHKSLYTHCNSLQLTATHCNTLQHTATHDAQKYWTLQVTLHTLQLTTTHHNSLQHTATHCNTPCSEVSSATRRSIEGDMSELNFSCLAPKIRSAANDPRVRRSRPCDAVSCSVLQRVAVFCSELQCVCVDYAHVNMYK